MFGKNFKGHFLKTMLLAWPVCVSNVGHVLVGIADTAMVGWIDQAQFGYSGTTAQAAVSLANGFYFLVLVFGIGISYGVTPLAAEADGAFNIEENKKLLGHSLVINVAVNILLLFLLLALSPAMKLLNQPAEVVKYAIPFLNVIMLSTIPFAVFSSLKQFAEGLSYTRAAMFITVGANVLNVLLNYLLIFGKWGCPAMGIMGACWASFIARALMALAMFLYIYYSRNFINYREGFRFRNISMERMKKIFSIGAASGMQWVFEVGAFAFALVMIGWIGEREQAAHQIALQLAAMTYLIASGISAAASVRVGNFLGARDVSGLREAAYSAFIMVLIFQVVFALLFVGTRFLVPPLFNDELAVQEIVSSLLLIAAIFQLSDGVQVVALGALRGVKDIALPTWITFISYWLVGLPASYLLAFVAGWGVEGIWYGLTLALTLAAVLLFARFNWVTGRVNVSE